ncbi:acetate--CoA ligase family protein [Pseudorhodoplanes sp.]|uniref:acetate--CoA ligase family protein n=1 Tax=Pseudorhodoplanes sp. TaxID=1934341 RepID=UPI003D0FD6DA
MAVVGASSNPRKSGGLLFSNLVNGGFVGDLYPINPGAKEVFGRQAYPSISQTPKKVDLAFVALPRDAALGAVEECGRAGCRAVCIIAAGFSEVGELGKADQLKLKKLAEQYDLLLIGPNTIGIIDAHTSMMGSFVGYPRWEKGGISLFAQSGIYNGAVMLEFMNQDVQRPGVMTSLAVGNKVDVDEIDFLDFAGADPETSVVGLYLESIDNPRAFMEKAAEVRTRKPVVVLKSGRTAEGARASASHTGSMMTDDALLQVGFKQFGIARADDEREFMNALRTLEMLPRPKGRRIAIATTSGALGVMSTDMLVSEGLQMAEFSTETTAKLQEILPAFIPPANPFDFWISVDLKGSKFAHEQGLEPIFQDPNVDAVIGILLAPAGAAFDEFGSLLRRLRDKYEKPFVVVIYGDDTGKKWLEDLEGARIPVFDSTRAAVRALSLAIQATC